MKNFMNDPRGVKKRQETARKAGLASAKKRREMKPIKEPSARDWEEKFDELKIFSTPVTEDLDGVRTFVVDVQEVKDFISNLIEQEKKKVIQDIILDLQDINIDLGVIPALDNYIARLESEGE